MEVDDVVMRTGDAETSTGWCFALTSMSPVVGSTGSLLLDSGSDAHLCTPKFADLITTSRDRSPLKLKDVQPSIWVLVVARWRRSAGKCRSTWNETVCVWRLMFCSAHRDLDTWRRERLSRMSAWMVQTSKSPIHRRVLASRGTSN